MRVRNDMLVAAIAAAVALSGASTAHAQGSASVTMGATAPKPPSVAVASPPVAPDEHLFTPPAVLGEGFTRALRAVIDGMKHVVDGERIEAAQAVGTPVASAHSAASTSRWARPSTTARAVRTAWLPAGALREAILVSPIQLTPVAIEPPSESGVDTRGEHALLLGVRMELPWSVP